MSKGTESPSDAPYGLDAEFPLLWGAALNADHRERLGLTVCQADEECARAMEQLWMARRDKAEQRECLREVTRISEELPGGYA